MVNRLLLALDNAKGALKAVKYLARNLNHDAAPTLLSLQIRSLSVRWVEAGTILSRKMEGRIHLAIRQRHVPCRRDN